MNFAIACGYIDANPMRGIRRNRRPALTRFLSREEIGRLHKALDRQTRKGGWEQADIIRLLLLTGCRKGEIVRLRWSEVDGDRLVLADSKTGPRTLPLNTQARRILERQPRDGSSFVFPSPPTSVSRPDSPPPVQPNRANGLRPEGRHHTGTRRRRGRPSPGWIFR